MLRFMIGVALGLAVVGCVGKGGPPSSPVKGTVHLDGKPLPDGEIAFFTPGEIPSTLEVKNGAFAGKANDGKSRVEVYQYRIGAAPMMAGAKVGDASRENTLPARYNAESTLTAEVVPGKDNEFKFDLTSK